MKDKELSFVFCLRMIVNDRREIVKDMAKTRIRSDVFEINNLETFCKIKMDMARQNMLMFSFVNFDSSKSAGEKVLAEATAYIDFPTAKLFAQDILSGRITALAKKEQDRVSAANEKYCKPIWTQMGGSNEKKCAEKGWRTDGKAISRVLNLTPGSKKPYILTIQQGAGESNDKGLIVPKFGTKPEVQIRVALDNDTLKQMALMINTHIDGFIAAQYARGAYEEELPDKKVA